MMRLPSEFNGCYNGEALKATHTGGFNFMFTMRFGVPPPINLAQVVTILTCILEVQIRNSSGDKDYSEVLRGFPQSIEANAEKTPSSSPVSLRSTSSQIYYSLSLVSQGFAGLLYKPQS
jgi:hypothetical protein